MGKIPEIFPTKVLEGYTQYKNMFIQNGVPLFEYTLQFSAIFKLPWILSFTHKKKEAEGNSPPLLIRQFSVKWWKQINENQANKEAVIKYYNSLIQESPGTTTSTSRTNSESKLSKTHATIPTQSPFTYPNPNPSASPSFTQDDTSESFIPEPTQPMPTFTQTAFSQHVVNYQQVQPNQSIFSQPAVHFQQTQPTQTNQTGYEDGVLDTDVIIIFGGCSAKEQSKEVGNRWKEIPLFILSMSLVISRLSVQRENKVRTLLLQALPEDHMPDFHHFDDARDIWMAVKARFGGNEESKKMRKTMLKQQFTEFSVTEEEGLHKGYDRFQKILSQLNQVQARPDNDDINLKFLRALPSSWSQVALALKTRGGLDSMSFDDLYNKLRSLELDVRIGHSYGVKVDAAPTHSAFIRAASSGSKLTYSDQPSIVPSVSQTSGRSDNIKECVLHSFAVDQLEMEELDLKWQMAMLSLRINRFEKKAGRKDELNNSILPDLTEGRLDAPMSSIASGYFAKECNQSAQKTRLVRVEKYKGMMAGLGGAGVSDAAAEFAMMGISPKLGRCMQFLPPSLELICPSHTMTSLQTQRPMHPVIQDYDQDKDVFPLLCYKDFCKSLNSVPCKSKAASVPAGSRNSSASVTAGGSDPAASRNRPAVNSAGRPNPTGRVGQAAHLAAAQSNPAGWSKRPAPVSAGWLNPAARPYFRPSSVYFNNMYWPELYDPMYMNEGRWGDPSTDNDIGNKEKLDDFVQVKGGIVKFGGGDGRISGKGTIRTSKLDFENVYYVEELQNFHLFSNYNNNIMILLVAKASLDESTRWHRRMAHVNFKTINKLDIGKGLVRVPLKVFTNEHNCVACNKGKQHKASYKHISAVRLITETLQLLHMDLFGPTNIRSIDQKYYSLVVTDDFSRCDNGTEFKNAKLIELCGEKGIKRDYSNPRTPQQNGVAERKNRTLIEAARTMLADSKLPTMFWTEAVSTACYVLNRVSITNPHNKTPYELISGKVPQIGHLKPFGCQVTILNTSDHLGKFEGKADEGYLVGYAPNSKAYRVYNLTNKRVEETMNLRFLEDKPNVQGIGHEWYFDLDYLTDSLGYTRFKTDKPAGTQETNINAGTQDHDSDSEVDEQVIVVPSFPSNSFAEYEAKDAAARYGYLFSQETAEILSQAEAEIRNQGVSADRDPAGIDPAGSFQPAGSYEPAGKGNPAVSTSVSADFIPIHAMEVIHLPSWVNTIHPQSQILGDLASPVLTRSKSSKSSLGVSVSLEIFYDSPKDQSYIPIHCCLLPCFLYSVRTNSIAKALEDPDWDMSSTDALLKELKRDARAETVPSCCPRQFTSVSIASRPDIMFAVSACSRHQVTPLDFHLNAVKKIFKYLKGQPKLGLWYPKGFSFSVGCLTNAKESSGLLWLLLQRRPSMFAAASCCGQVLKIHTDDNVADLLTKAFDGPRFEYLVVHIRMVDMVFCGISFLCDLCRSSFTAASCTFFLLTGCSPWLTAKKEFGSPLQTALWLVQEGTALGKDDLMMRMTKTDWLNLMMQVGSNPALAKELLGADVNEGNFIERMTAVKEWKKRALADLRYRALKGKPLKKSELVEEYEYICRRLEKDRLLSAQYNLFRPKPAITEPPSKRQRVERASSQPASVPAATTHTADDPDSAGGGSSNPAGSATPMAGSAASNTAGGTFDATGIDSTVTTTAAMDSAGSRREIGVSPFADSAASSSPSNVSIDHIPIDVLFESTSGGILEFFLDSDEEEKIGMSRVVADPDSDDEVFAEIIFRGKSISGDGVVFVDKLPDDEIVDPRVKVETVSESASSPPRSRRKHLGVRSDDFLWDKPVEDFSVESSPWLTAKKESGSPLQTALVCNSNPLIALLELDVVFYGFFILRLEIAAGYIVSAWVFVMLLDRFSSSVPADYVSAGHVLVSADRDRIC
ncbi:putative ribonuclease H-like domain-containing protein [Tanacetum coccineum]